MIAPPRARRIGLELATVLVVLVSALSVMSLGARGPSSLTFQLGPNDYAYLVGFVSHYEVEDNVAVRWTTYDATVDLPLTIEGGPLTLAYRFARVFPETAEVEVYLDESLIDRFSCRGGKVETRETELAAVSSTPLRIHFAVNSHERRNLGLRLDWIRVDTGDRAVTYLRGAPRWLPALLAAFLVALLRFGGLTRNVSLLLSLAWVAVAALWFRWDGFGFANVMRELCVPAMAFSSLAALFLRRMPQGSVVVPIFVMCYLLRGAGLFLPQTFYPDVANARDYVEAFRETSGTLAERGVEAQTRTNVGYPRTVAGKDYAFPYSPLYFLPFSVFHDPGRIEDAVRHVGLAAATFTLLPLFWIASMIFGSRAAIAASFLWTFLPPIFSRLLLALHATLVGNFLDTVVIATVLALALYPTSRRRLAAVAGATLTSLLIYTSSLFSMTAFFAFASALDRKLAPKLLAVLIVSGLITVGWLYWPFALAFFTEILPAVASGGGVSGGASADPAWVAFARIPLFYGYAYPLLAVFGVVLAHRSSTREGYRIVLAWTLAFALMLGLRAFGAGLFKDLKEIVFAAPLVAILSGASLVALERRGRWGRLAAALVLSGLVLFGLNRYRGYLESYRSPLMASWRATAAQTK